MKLKKQEGKNMTREQLHALKERIFERRNEPEMLKVMAVADELYSMCSYYGLFEEAETK